MREPGKIHKSLQEECFTEIGKRQVSVSTMDCLYLLSQVIAQHSLEFLQKVKTLKKADKSCLQTKLAVMQKGETFNSLYKLLLLIDQYGDFIIEKQRFVWDFKEKKPKTLLSLYSLMNYLGKIFLDVRLALGANLVALQHDGRITL